MIPHFLPVLRNAQIETPGLAWDYWWSGACAHGAAEGPGFLFEFMKAGGMGDVYAVQMHAGRMTGEVTAYGPAFMATEWRVRAGVVDESDGEIRDWRELDRDVPRQFLPARLQDAVERFSRAVGHPQVPPLPPLAANDQPARCLPVLHIEPPVEGAPSRFDPRSFIAAHTSYATAREEVLLAAIALAQRGDPAAPAWLRMASAVVGCKPGAPGG
jgi:hypothetical protein